MARDGLTITSGIVATTTMHQQRMEEESVTRFHLDMKHGISILLGQVMNTVISLVDNSIIWVRMLVE